MKGIFNRTVSAAAVISGLMATSPARAQDTDASSQSQSNNQDIIVTGTRLRTTGFDAPTPTQVIGIQDIQQAAPKLIDDFLNQVPSISGSMTLRGRVVQGSNGTNGISSPALRSIGSNRTLVLLDGQRTPAVTQTGETDVLSFPTQLIQRIDVVTGGASALYGSDALAGVVNFVLDKKFTGLKMEVQGGITTYGDDKNYKFAGSYGTGFADGCGHLLLSSEYQWNEGVGRDFDRLLAGKGSRRSWLRGQPQLVVNPAYNRVTNPGVPQYINGPSHSTGASNNTIGGIITNGPLRGTAFTLNGMPYAFNYGLSDGVNQIGGDWQASDISALTGLDPSLKRLNIFARADFDITDNINLFAQYMYSDSSVYGNYATRVWQGTPNAQQNGSLVLRSDNPYLRAALANDPERLALLDTVSTVNFGTVSEAEASGGAVDRKFNRLVVGGRGDINLGSKSFTWNAYFQHGIARAHEMAPGSHIASHLVNAVDAVRNSSGQIVCRINADAITTNDDAACAPLNVIGYDGVVDPAALAYVYGRAYRDQKFTQDVWSFDIAGEPVDLWAGPVSIALGGEHRREKVRGTEDPISAAGMINPANGWGGNFIAVNGSYHVTEGFLEVSVPLLKDSAIAKSLKIDGAVRATQYSTSGYVTTWKAGGVWEPVDGVRVRVTQSRDIRAPSIAELFSPGLIITSSVVETRDGVIIPHAGVDVVTTGNLNLTPEKADTTGIGVVLQPGFVPGLSLSVDWYKIGIKDAIGTVTQQTIVTQCSQGDTTFCPLIIRNPAGGIIRINNSPFNFASQKFKGLDFEATYRTSLGDGTLTLRGFATRYLTAKSNDGISPELNYLGDHVQANGTPSIGSLPKLKYRLSATYDTEPFTFVLTGRGASSGLWSRLNVECSTSCPTTLPPGSIRTVQDNHAPASFYIDTSFTVRPKWGFNPEFFFSINNLLNENPPLWPRTPTASTGGVATNPVIYDTLGRTFTAGLRVKI